jgi:hypothetical protein
MCLCDTLFQVLQAAHAAAQSCMIAAGSIAGAAKQIELLLNRKQQ